MPVGAAVASGKTSRQSKASRHNKGWKSTPWRQSEENNRGEDSKSRHATEEKPQSPKEKNTQWALR
jgi:hypothetical protein